MSAARDVTEYTHEQGILGPSSSEQETNQSVACIRCLARIRTKYSRQVDYQTVQR